MWDSGATKMLVTLSFVGNDGVKTLMWAYGLPHIIQEPSISIYSEETRPYRHSLWLEFCVYPPIWRRRSRASIENPRVLKSNYELGHVE